MSLRCETPADAFLLVKAGPVRAGSGVVALFAIDLVLPLTMRKHSPSPTHSAYRTFWDAAERRSWLDGRSWASRVDMSTFEWYKHQIFR